MKCKEKNYWFLFFNRSTHSEVFCKILKFKQNSQEYTYDGGFCFNKVIKCSATFRSFHISRKRRKHKSSASSETFTTSFFLPGRVLSSPHISVHFSFATALSQSCGVNCANSRQYIFVLVGGSFEKLEISF